ncbi:MAG: hypothetical protein ACRD63_06720, partial [Pyrinomonadaceae bacterium]
GAHTVTGNKRLLGRWPQSAPKRPEPVCDLQASWLSVKSSDCEKKCHGLNTYPLPQMLLTFTFCPETERKHDAPEEKHHTAPPKIDVNVERMRVNTHIAVREKSVT